VRIQISVTAVCAGGAATGNGGVLPNSDGGLLVRHPDEAERRVKRDDKAIDIGGLEVAPPPEGPEGLAPR
jgi:hypothetical protein